MRSNTYFGNVGAEMESHVFEADLQLASGRRDKARELLASACDLMELQPFYEGNAYCLEVVAAYAGRRREHHRCRSAAGPGMGAS